MKYIYFIASDNTVPTKESARNICQEMMEATGEESINCTFRYGPDVNDPIKLHNELLKMDRSSTVRFIFIDKVSGGIGLLHDDGLTEFLQTLKNSNEDQDVLKDIQTKRTTTGQMISMIANGRS